MPGILGSPSHSSRGATFRSQAQYSSHQATAAYKWWTFLLTVLPTKTLATLCVWKKQICNKCGQRTISRKKKVFFSWLSLCFLSPLIGEWSLHVLPMNNMDFHLEIRFLAKVQKHASEVTWSWNVCGASNKSLYKLNKNLSNVTIKCYNDHIYS